MKSESKFAVFIAVVFGLISSALHVAVSTLLWLVGLIVCALAVACGAYETRYEKRFQRSGLHWKWRWMWLWDNDEDGIDGMRPWAFGWINPWFTKTAKWSESTRILVWSCWRNPIGNLRFVRPFAFSIKQELVRYVGNSRDPQTDFERAPGTYWYLAWHEWYVGTWVIYRGKQLRLGWRIVPKDADGVDPDDARSKGCSFTFQFGSATRDTGTPPVRSQ